MYQYQYYVYRRHQKMEIEALDSRVNLLKEEHSHSKEDVDRFTSDVALKVKQLVNIFREQEQLFCQCYLPNTSKTVCTQIKEDAAAMDTAEQMSTERSRLQLEKYQLEQSRGEVERKNHEISELHQKVTLLLIKVL